MNQTASVRAWLAGACLLLSACASGTPAVREQSRTPLTVSAENAVFEWFVLPVEIGKERGIWARHGLDPHFVPAAASAAELGQQVDSGVEIGLVNTAEVP